MREGRREGKREIVRETKGIDKAEGSVRYRQNEAK